MRSPAAWESGLTCQTKCQFCLTSPIQEDAMAEIAERPVAERRRESLRKAADEAGLLDGPKSKQLAGRFPGTLVAEAQRRAGITETTELLTYALMKVAMEDDFGERLLARKGRVPKGVFVVED